MSRWLESRGLVASEWTPDRFGESLQVRERSHGYLYSVKALASGLTVLRRVGAVPEVHDQAAEETSVEALERRFRDYLVAERGLAEVSARTYSFRARPFLLDRARDGGLDLESLTAADVSRFVAGWLPGLSKAPAKSTVTALRSLLKFPYATGVVTRPLAAVARTVASWKLPGLPIGLAPRQVQALLNACDQSTIVGRRDFAVATLLAAAALRTRWARATAGTACQRGCGPEVG